jgi:hypothetical protein
MNERIRRKRRTKAAAIVTVALVSGWIALSACSNMSEGERCQVANNSDDCQDGLICLPANQVNPNYANADRCCPPDRTKATHPACTLLQSSVAGDSAPPADTGPVGTDSGGDTGADAGSDAADADAGELDAADAADE